MNKSGIGILRDENGKQVTDDQSKADLLGKFFSSVFTNDNHVTPQIDKLVDPDIELSDVHFSPDLVWHAINKLKAKHSSGPDGYSSDFTWLTVFPYLQHCYLLLCLQLALCLLFGAQQRLHLYLKKAFPVT